LSFGVLVLLQALVLDNIPRQTQSTINPIIYPYFLLILPVVISRWALLLIAFALGLSVDIFLDTLGLHAAATVLIAYLRPGLITLTTQKGGFEAGDEPRVKTFGIQWFFVYSFILLLCHHTVYFLLESFSFKDIGHTFLKVLVSVSISLLLLILLEYLFYSKKTTRSN
jgi:rod shape-determining protein MreD